VCVCVCVCVCLWNGWNDLESSVTSNSTWTLGLSGGGLFGFQVLRKKKASNSAGEHFINLCCTAPLRRSIVINCCNLLFWYAHFRLCLLSSILGDFWRPPGSRRKVVTPSRGLYKWTVLVGMLSCVLKATHWVAALDSALPGPVCPETLVSLSLEEQVAPPSRDNMSHTCVETVRGKILSVIMPKICLAAI